MPRRIPGITFVIAALATVVLAGSLAGQSKGLASRTSPNYRLRYDKNVSAEEIKKLGKQLELACAMYTGRLGASFPRKVDVYCFSSPGRFRSESRSGVYDDGDIRDGKLYFNVDVVLKCDTALRDPVSRVVSEAILGEIKWCPKWLAEVYGIYAG